MTYPEVIDYLYQQLPMFSRIGGSAFKKDLSNIRALCKALGDPQKKFKSIHVGGTNGKGSVSHMLAAIFQQSGYKTGLHTSPHLVDFRERIRVNGIVVTKEFVIQFIEQHQPLLAQIKPSFFELSVAMAFQWFAEEKVDIAIVEVGLGGRLDSTNILNPVLSVITNISLEHTQILGDTRALIAGEKAGIIKENTPVIIGETKEETQPVFLKKAQEKKADIFFADQEFLVEESKKTLIGQWVKIISPHEREEELYLDLGGGYQIQNLQTVFSVLRQLQKLHWVLPEESVKNALKQVKHLTGLRGRWDILEEEPLFIADTSHNVAGIREVVKQCKTISYRKLYFIIGFVKDKNVEEILSIFPKEATYYFCHADNPRSLPSGTLHEMAIKKELGGEAYPSVSAAISAAKEDATAGDCILLTGSTFVVAEALQEKSIVI